MPPLAADKLDEILVRLFTVWLRRLETAPSDERWVFTVLMAVSILAMAVVALVALLMDGPEDEVLVVKMVA